MGGVGESTLFSSVPAQAYGACYGKTCFSTVRALFFKELRGRAAKTVFGLKYFSGFSLIYLHGNMLFHVVSVCVWDTSG